MTSDFRLQLYMNESQEAVLLVTFRADIFSVKHHIPTCTYSPTDISIKASKGA